MPLIKSPTGVAAKGKEEPLYVPAILPPSLMESHDLPKPFQLWRTKDFLEGLQDRTNSANIRENARQLLESCVVRHFKTMVTEPPATRGSSTPPFSHPPHGDGTSCDLFFGPASHRSGSQPTSNWGWPMGQIPLLLSSPIPQKAKE